MSIVVRRLHRLRGPVDPRLPPPELDLHVYLLARLDAELTRLHRLRDTLASPRTTRPGARWQAIAASAAAARRYADDVSSALGEIAVVPVNSDAERAPTGEPAGPARWRPSGQTVLARARPDLGTLVPMDLGLHGRVYVLTGASRGLGFAAAAELVADGARVVVSARRQSTVDAAVQRLGDGAAGIAADLGDPATPARLTGLAMQRFGRLDGALLSVGGPPPGSALDATDEQWSTAFETIFLGAVRTARTVAKALDSGGAIGFVLSTSVRSPVPGLGISNGLRPGLAGFAKSLADELAPRGVRTFSLLPGRIRTDRNVELFAATGDPDRARAEAEAAVPLRRLGEPAEFGRVAAFLLSPAASYLTGITVPVDGGATRAI